MGTDTMRARIEWSGGLLFTGSAGDHELAIDGEHRRGCSPTELLMLSLAGCMAIDVVLILQKRRAQLQTVRASVEGTRAEQPPRRFRRLGLHFEIAGTGLDERKMARALSLSREKYCSVLHSLREDMDFEFTYTLSEPKGS